MVQSANKIEIIVDEYVKKMKKMKNDGEEVENIVEE